MIIQKTEIFKRTETLIYPDNALPEELLLQVFSKKIMTKAAKKGAGKRSAARKATGKKTNCGF